MLEMLPTVMVVAVTPVAVAPPLPPAGVWLPFAPHAPAPFDTPARVAGFAAAAPLLPGWELEDPLLPGEPAARPGELDDAHGAVVVVVLDVVDADPDFAFVVVVEDDF